MRIFLRISANHLLEQFVLNGKSHHHEKLWWWRKKDAAMTCAYDVSVFMSYRNFCSNCRFTPAVFGSHPPSADSVPAEGWSAGTTSLQNFAKGNLLSPSDVAEKFGVAGNFQYTFLGMVAYLVPVKAGNR